MCVVIGTFATILINIKEARMNRKQQFFAGLMGCLLFVFAQGIHGTDNPTVRTASGVVRGAT